jgi:hypothetical protein
MKGVPVTIATKNTRKKFNQENERPPHSYSKGDNQQSEEKLRVREKIFATIHLKKEFYKAQYPSQIIQ